MTAPDDDPLDLLAAEYVIGTLRGPDCERFEQRMEYEPDLARRVREWEARLAPLLEHVEPADPPATAWAGIERRLFAAERGIASGAVSGAVSFWRRLALGFASFAIVILATTSYLHLKTDQPQCYAVLSDASSMPMAVVFDRSQMLELVVLPVGSRLAAAGAGTAQLWIVTGNHAMPVGLLNTGGETRLALDKPMLTAVMAAQARLVVTREQPGGSATGAPTGERIAEGVVAFLGAPSVPAKAI